MGHDARIISPTFVKPVVKSNKNDRADAQAIAEAVQRKSMRFVVIKTVDQQALQAAHRVRERAVGNRTALVNEIRGLLAEFGIEIPQGRQKVAPAVSEVLSDGGTDKITLPGRFVATLHELYNELLHMTARIARYDAMIEEEADTHKQAKLLMTILGIDPKMATAMLTTMGDPGNYRNGWEWAASIDRGQGQAAGDLKTGGSLPALSVGPRGQVGDQPDRPQGQDGCP